MSYKQKVIPRLETRDAKVGIVGLGYTGLLLAIELAEPSYNVIGLYVGAQKVHSLNSNISYTQ